VLFKDPGTTEKMLTKMVSLENLDLTVASPIEEIRAFTKKLWRLIASPIFQPVPYDETLAVRAAKWDEADEGDDEEEAGGDKTEYKQDKAGEEDEEGKKKKQEEDKGKSDVAFEFVKAAFHLMLGGRMPAAAARICTVVYWFSLLVDTNIAVRSNMLILPWLGLNRYSAEPAVIRPSIWVVSGLLAENPDSPIPVEARRQNAELLLGIHQIFLDKKLGLLSGCIASFGRRIM